MSSFDFSPTILIKNDEAMQNSMPYSNIDCYRTESGELSPQKKKSIASTTSFIAMNAALVMLAIAPTLESPHVLVCGMLFGSLAIAFLQGSYHHERQRQVFIQKVFSKASLRQFDGTLLITSLSLVMEMYGWFHAVQHFGLWLCGILGFAADTLTKILSRVILQHQVEFSEPRKIMLWIGYCSCFVFVGVDSITSQALGAFKFFIIISMRVLQVCLEGSNAATRNGLKGPVRQAIVLGLALALVLPLVLWQYYSSSNLETAEIGRPSLSAIVQFSRGTVVGALLQYARSRSLVTSYPPFALAAANFVFASIFSLPMPTYAVLLPHFLVLLSTGRAQFSTHPHADFNRSSLFNMQDVYTHLMNDSDSRKITIFLAFNIVFMFVEIIVGWWSNSLGLISDAGHMFFDNGALMIGLGASYISKWKADSKYTYGYGRYEVLSGFINSMLLLFIAFSVFQEACSRFSNPPEIHSDHLLVTSILGFLVNLVGLVCFHDLSHGHGGSSCSGSSGHSHGHSHGSNDNMYGGQWVFRLNE